MKSLITILNKRFEEGMTQMGYTFKQTNISYYKVTGKKFTRWYSLNGDATHIRFIEYTFSGPEFEFFKEIITEEDLIQAIEEFLTMYATSLN